MRSPKTLILALSLVLGAAACSGGGGGGGGPIKPPVVEIVPRQFEPSEPGLLQIGPAGLTLERGENFKLRPSLVNGLGVSQNSSTLTWTAETPRIASVAADGTIDGLEAGTAIVTASDEGRRVASLLVEVVPPGELPQGPVAVKFQSPILNLTVGERQSPAFDLTDAKGTIATTQQQIRFVADGDRIEVEPTTGQITAVSEGLSTIRVVLVDDQGGETPLAGQLLVLVLDPAQPTDPIECEWKIVDGDFYGPPIFYSRPGLSAELRTLVYERKYCSSGISGIELRVRQVAPRRVSIVDTNVASIGQTGLLESKAAGRTRVEGILVRKDEQEVSIPGFMVTVLPRLGGTWRVSAPNGDRGQIRLPETPALVEKRIDRRNEDGTLAAQGGAKQIMSPRVRLRGRGILVDSNNQSVCDSEAFLNCSFLLIGGSFNASGVCSERAPGRLNVFSVPLLTYCGQDRHPVRFGGELRWSCTGPDTLRGTNGVELTRAPAPPVTNLASVEVDGVPLRDPNPGASLGLGTDELLVSFFKDGDQDDFGIVLSLRGIKEPGQYTLSNVGSFSSLNSNFMVYGRFDPEAAWSTSATTVVEINIERYDEQRFRATFSGTLADLDLAGTGSKPNVVLSNGIVDVGITNFETGSASFDLGGKRFEEKDPSGEWDGNEFYLDIEATSGNEGWSLAVELEGVTGPGTYVADESFTGNAASLSNLQPNSFVYVPKNGRQLTITITEIDETSARGTFQGSLQNVQFNPGDTKVITGGEFEVFF